MEPLENGNRFGGKPQDITPYIKSGKKLQERGRIVTILSNLMASTFSLSSRTFQLHWNAGGEIDSQLQGCIKDQAKDLFSAVREIAALIRNLGWDIPETNHKTNYPAINLETDDLPVMLEELVHNHDNILSYIQSHLRFVAESGDDTTLSLLKERQRIHSENAIALDTFRKGRVAHARGTA